MGIKEQQLILIGRIHQNGYTARHILFNTEFGVSSIQRHGNDAEMNSWKGVVAVSANECSKKNIDEHSKNPINGLTIVNVKNQRNKQTMSSISGNYFLNLEVEGTGRRLVITTHILDTKNVNTHIFCVMLWFCFLVNIFGLTRKNSTSLTYNERTCRVAKDSCPPDDLLHIRWLCFDLFEREMFRTLSRN